MNQHRPPGMPQMGQATLLGQREAQIQQAIQQAIQQLSLGIYSDLAAAHIGTRDEHQSVDLDYLRSLAGESLAAAQAYFEGVGVIQVGTPPQADSAG